MEWYERFGRLNVLLVVDKLEEIVEVLSRKEDSYHTGLFELILPAGGSHTTDTAIKLKKGFDKPKEPRRHDLCIIRKRDGRFTVIASNMFKIKNLSPGEARDAYTHLDYCMQEFSAKQPSATREEIMEHWMRDMIYDFPENVVKIKMIQKGA